MLDKEEMRLQTVKLDLAKAEEEVSVSPFVQVN